MGEKQHFSGENQQIPDLSKQNLIDQINKVVVNHYDNYISYAKQNLLNIYKETENSHIDLVHYVIESTIERATRTTENQERFQRMVEENKLHYYILTAVINNSKYTTFPFIREFIKQQHKTLRLDDITANNNVFNDDENEQQQIKDLQQEKIDKINAAMKACEKNCDLIDLLMFKVYMYNDITYDQIAQIFNTTKSQAFSKINKIKSAIIAKVK